MIPKTAVIFVLVLSLGSLRSFVTACSWDYPVWPKNKKSDTPLFRFVIQENHAGYIDRDGKIVIPAKYRSTGNHGSDDFFGGLASALDDDGFWYIDASGKRVLRDDGMRTPFSEGVAPKTDKATSKVGYIQPTGQFVIPAVFESGSDFSEGLAAVSLNGRRGYINHRGELVIQPQFRAAEKFAEQAARVIIDGPCSVYDRGPCGYPFNPPTPVPYVFTKDRNYVFTLPRCRYSFIDTRGRRLFDQDFVEADDFSEGLAAVGDGKSWGFVDRTGVIRIPLQYEAVGPFSEGLARVFKDKKWGFVDKAGRFVIPVQFQDADDFSEGLAAVGNRDEHWFIDHSGRQAIPEKFLDASSFVMGRAHVRQGRDYYKAKWSYIDHAGRSVFAYSDKGPESLR